MSASPTLHDTLGPVGRRLRREGAAAVVGIVLGLGPAVLVVAWAVGRWGLRGPGPLLLLGAAGAVGLGAAVLLGRRWVRSVDETAVAAAVERSRGLTEGSLRGVLELGRGLPEGVSAALLRRSESQLAGRLDGAGERELAGELGRGTRRRLLRVGLGVLSLGLLAGALGFAAPDRARAAWTPLLEPVAHLRGPVLPPVRVTPGDTAVERGAVVAVAVDAPLRTGARVHWRSVGEVPHDRRVALEAGRGSLDMGPVDAPTRYWVRTPDGAVSDTFTITPADPLLMAELRVDVTYPRYLERAPDHYRGEVSTLRVPEGARLEVAGVATRPLRAATVAGPDGSRAAEVDGAGFRFELRAASAATGRWSWTLEDPAGRSLADAAVLDLVVVPDEAPAVRVTVPGADTVMPASRRVQLVAVATDDHGLAAAEVVSRRVGPGGSAGETARAPLALDVRGPRSTARGLLDASELELAAGDEVAYHVVVRDESPGGQTGRSATYRLRVPDMAALRDRARDEAAGSVEALSRLADRARELEARTRALSRRSNSRGEAGQPGAGGGRGENGQSLGYEEASEAREVLEAHESMRERVEALRERLGALDRAIEEAGLRDPELQRRLDELRALMQELAGPELQERVERLREATDALDAAEAAAALEQLAARQEALREEVERSLEMMRRAAAEQELSALAREAEEIAARQAALAEAMAEESRPPDPAGDGDRAAEPDAAAPTGATPDSASTGSDGVGPGPAPPTPSLEERAAQQDELEERANRLGGLLQSLQQQLLRLGEEESSTRTGSAREQGEASREAMEEAGDRARRQEGGRAAESGRRAAESMSRAADELDAARARMSAEQAAQARESVRQATRDALELAQRQESLRREMEDAAGRRGAASPGAQELAAEQAALRQGLEQMARNLSAAGQRSAMIDPAVRRALERARMNMSRTQAGLEEAPMPTAEAGRSVESLNQLAMALLENEAGMQGGQGAAGLQAALQRLADAAREQGAINGQLSGLAPMRLGERAMTQQLGEAARRQRGVGRRLGEASDMVGGREDVLGQLDQLSAEAERIARELEGGRLEPEVRARQERLFHRLLDAGRSLEREEYSDERVRERPQDTGISVPAALDPSLLDGSVRYPLPTSEQLDRLPPAYRRMILEYFQRLNERAGGGR